MTARDRHTPDAGPTQPAPGDRSLWADWYPRASPPQQQEALERAVRQGVLYAHQLPAPAHAAPRAPLPAALLNGPVRDLEPLHPSEPEWHDRQLDRTQREAVARAVSTPDVCLIQGFPGTGKSRVVAEIVLQAARRGERVLLLAATTAALDRVLGRLGSHPDVCPVRCLAAEESPDALPAGISRLTLKGRLNFYREDTVPAARAARDAARAAHEARLREEPLWARLEELAAREEELAGRRQALARRRDDLAAEVDRATAAPNADPFRARWDARAAEHRAAVERLDGQLAGLRSERETIAGKLVHLEGEWERIRPLVEARRGGRFWSGAWWSAVLRGGLAAEARALEQRRDELQAALRRLEQEVAGREAERAEVEQRFASECRRLKGEEIARRRVELDTEDEAVSRQREGLREPWREACRGLADGLAPAEASRAAVAAARAEWDRLRARQEQEAAAAEDWLRAVEDGLHTLPQRLAGCANVVAATTTALPGDPHFGDRHGEPVAAFDLLVLEEAHEVTESEFAAAARRAARWVLVGEPQPDEEPAPRKPVSSAALRPGFFQRLWRRLHADPHRLPYAWSQHDGRLHCRLRPVPAGQERSVESEPVVDRPEVELRILTSPRQPPQLVEVVFPACTPVAEAKQFLFRELDEPAVQTRGRTLCWSETDEDVVLELAPDGDPQAVTFPLGEGVSERVGRAAPGRAGDEDVFWDTCRLQFHRAAGWTRQRAEEWVAERLGLRDAGRTVLLTVPYRLAPPLADFVSDLLFGGACRPPADGLVPPLARPPIEFVAVPPVPAPEGRHRPRPAPPWDAGAPGGAGRAAVSVRAARPQAVKGGAGLEVDLTDRRPLEQLPADLRADLPASGLVNYFEARAVVSRLEALAHDAAFRAACEARRNCADGPCAHGRAAPAECACPPDAGPDVAVMALYPAQAELIRQLIRRSPALADAPVAFEVGPPSAFAQRECLLALVSLTRSHAHRAVSYGEHPHALPQALTRAASGVILFGDPGTLARRCQWQGALDHLDEAAARREAGLVGRLLHYLQGRGAHPSAFRLHEDRGA